MDIKRLNIKGFNDYQGKILKLQTISFLSSFDISEEFASNLARKKNKSLKENLENNNCFLVSAFIENHLVGFVWFFELETFEERKIHINQIVVDLDYRRQGIATALLKEVEKIAKDLDIKIVELNVTNSNEHALNMYESMNFKTERRLMKKVLSE